MNEGVEGKTGTMGGVGEEAWEQCPALGRVTWARDCVLKKNGSGWRGKWGWGQRCSAKEKEETTWPSADEKETHGNEQCFRYGQAQQYLTGWLKPEGNLSLPHPRSQDMVV